MEQIVAVLVVMNKVMITNWIIRVGLFLIFLISSLGKFDLHGNMAGNFIRWGLPLSLMVFIGVCEFLGGILLLVPRYAVQGAFLLIGIMIGSVAQHIVQHNEMGFPLLPLVIITLLLITAITHSSRSYSFKRIKDE